MQINRSQVNPSFKSIEISGKGLDKAGIDAFIQSLVESPTLAQKGQRLVLDETVSGDGRFYGRELNAESDEPGFNKAEAEKAIVALLEKNMSALTRLHGIMGSFSVRYIEDPKQQTTQQKADPLAGLQL